MNFFNKKGKGFSVKIGNTSRIGTIVYIDGENNYYNEIMFSSGTNREYMIKEIKNIIEKL